jgi:cytochrome P450
VWAIGRFDEVRSALRADDVLVSGRGVALNDFVNQLPSHTTLTSDGELHRRRRGVLMKPMMPSALAEVPGAERMADGWSRARVPRVRRHRRFARHPPVAVVSHLIGLPERAASACSSGRPP